MYLTAIRSSLGEVFNTFMSLHHDSKFLTKFNEERQGPYTLSKSIMMFLGRLL